MPLTLYQDWQLRRKRIDSGASALIIRDQSRVLDFLLSKYQDHPDAQRPARYSPKTQTVLNSRAIIIHHHIYGEQFNGIKSEREAAANARRILTLIAHVNPQATLRPPGSNLNLWSGVKLNKNTLWVPIKEFFLKRRLLLLGIALSDGSPRADVIDLCRRLQQTNQPLPPSALEQLFLWAPTYKLAMEVLINCIGTKNKEAERWFVSEYIQGHQSLTGLFLEGLGKALINPSEETLIDLRGFLSDRDLATRIRTAALLAVSGTLQDIALLQDLLEIPEVHTDPAESNAYKVAIQELAGM